MNEYDDVFGTPEKEQTETEPTSFDREEWIRQKRAEREHAYELMDQTAEMIARDPGRLMTYLDIQSRFPALSVGNVLLLQAQKPDATLVYDFNTWKQRGISINRGETGIMILEPGKEYSREDGSKGVNYNAKRVFDISQTTAEKHKDPEVQKDARLLLKALIFKTPCEIQLEDSVPQANGHCAIYDPEGKVIHVEKGHNIRELFIEIAQELAHAHLDKGDHDRYPYDRSRNAFTAFCASYMICRRNGIAVNDYHFDVEKELAGKEPKQIRTELSKMRSAANAISKDMNALHEKQKEEKNRCDAR